MTTKQDVLDRVAVLFDERELAAARALEESRARERTAIERAGTLLDHCNEYLGELAERGRGGMDATQLRSYRHFIAQLDRLHADQLRIADAQTRELAQRRALWVDARARARGIARVREDRARERERARERAEQHAMDDLVNARIAGERDRQPEQVHPVRGRTIVQRPANRLLR